jgi:hypothetical protein
MTESELLFRVLIVALDAPAHFGHKHKLFKCRLLGAVPRKYLSGSVSPSGHSISSHSPSRTVLRQWSRCAGQTRTAAKHEESAALLPSCQVTVRQAFTSSRSFSAASEPNVDTFCQSRRRLSRTFFSICPFSQLHITPCGNSQTAMQRSAVRSFLTLLYIGYLNDSPNRNAAQHMRTVLRGDGDHSATESSALFKLDCPSADRIGVVRYLH